MAKVASFQSHEDFDCSYSREMCPQKEAKLYERRLHLYHYTTFLSRRLENELVHTLEAYPTLRLVKSFTRSAAGYRIGKGDLRSAQLCLKTARYLVKE